MNDFYNMIFPLKELEYAGNYPGLFRDYIILTFWNDVLAEFNKSLLIELLGEIHIYDFIDNIDINEDNMDHISQEFL